MNNRIKRTITGISAAMVLLCAVCTSAFSEADVIGTPEAFAELDAAIEPFAAVNTPETYINLDFDKTGSAGDFKNEQYQRSTRTIETDSQTGNKFIRFTYDAENTEAPLYSEDMYPTSGAYSTLDIRGNIVMSFDVHFGSNDGTIYLKERKSGVNSIVLRVGTRSDGRLVYGSSNGANFFLDKNQNYFYVQDKWYNVQIVANITTNEDLAKQSIYVTDKLTGELETKIENVAINKAVSSCNIVVVGTSHYVDLDNLIIEEDDVQNLRIVGNPYPVCGRNSTYAVRSLTKSGVALFNNEITPTWSLVNTVNGVTIDSSTGVLTVAANASLSPVIIKASAEIDGVTKDWYYLVEIEK